MVGRGCSKGGACFDVQVVELAAIVNAFGAINQWSVLVGTKAFVAFQILVRDNLMYVHRQDNIYLVAFFPIIFYDCITILNRISYFFSIQFYNYLCFGGVDVAVEVAFDRLIDSPTGDADS